MKLRRLVSRKLWSCSLVAVAGLLLATGAQGASLTFDQINNGGALSYNGLPGGALVGTNIVFTSITGSGTDNDGTIDCNDCRLNFTTGALITTDGNDYVFDAGGTITLTGGSLAANIPPNVALLSGTWTSQVKVTIEAGGPIPNGYLLMVGAGQDTKDPTLVDYFFNTPPTNWTFVNSQIQVESQPGGITQNGLAFTADLSKGGNSDFINAVVPEPGTALLMGLGLAGLGLTGRSRREEGQGAA